LKPSPSSFTRRHAARTGTRSVALVLTLVVLVIVSALTVGFFAMASHDLQATQSYDSSVNVEKITLGGIAQIVAQMRAQAADPAFSTTNGTGTNVLYIPLSAARALPQHMASNSALPTLLTVSGLAVYGSGNAAAGTNLASSCYTTNASLNHRSVSPAIWQEPELVPSANSSSLPVPQWILMTRGGPAAFTSYTSSLGSNALGNTNYVLGRYAYTVYDLSGLLDITVAGYPSMASNGASLKGLLPWADLTQLGVGSADVDNLVQWRNAATTTNYAAYVTNWATNGFMQVAPGDTTFLSRQELIAYAQQSGHTAWTNALPYLTTFSREFNGPTWKPTTNLSIPYNYIAHEYQPTTSGSTNDNVFILNPRVLTAFTRANGSSASVGEPLVKYRFPLNKLALLEKMKGLGTLSAADISNIQAYFGLDIASDITAATGLYRHWNYPTTNPSYPHTAGRILTLDEVAALVPAREPDFFELLQAGILQGSVGYVPTFNYPANTKGSVRGDFRLNTGISAARPDPDNSITYQILRIGANLIDQWDADSYPTTVTFNLGGATQDFYGIEDLPYINELFMKAYGNQTNGYTVYAYFELWNPHANTVTNAALYPSSFRILPLASANVASADSYTLQLIGKEASGDSDFGIWAYNGTAYSAANTKKYFGGLPSGGAIPFTTVPATSYREPALISGTPVGPPSGWAITTPVWSQASSLGAWVLGSLPIPATNTAPTGTSGSGSDLPAKWGQVTSFQLNYVFDAVVPIQYADKNGTYHTYSTFMGLENTSLDTGYHSAAYNSPTATDDPSYNAWSFPKSDPRTYRYGTMGTVTPATGVYSNSANVGLTPALCNSAATLDSPAYINPPFYGPGNNLSTLQNYRLDLWSVNDPAVPPQGPTPASPNTNSYYPDSDGVYRPGDAHTSYPTGSPLYTGATANRPVILNRPFQSVGDLGYAFRDAPWKTLDFSSSNSADAALLDLFSAEGGMISAGKINPNTPYPQVLSALISGALQSASGNTLVSSNNASSAASAIVAGTGATPFLNRADIVGLAMGTVGPKISTIKSEREAVVRALADSANLRTWNLFIDIVGQAGQYPPSAATLNDFVVTGQRHYWLHIAIDRYTGAVIDQQLEVVSE